MEIIVILLFAFSAVARSMESGITKDAVNALLKDIVSHSNDHGRRRWVPKWEKSVFVSFVQGVSCFFFVSCRKAHRFPVIYFDYYSALTNNLWTLLQTLYYKVLLVFELIDYKTYWIHLPLGYERCQFSNFTLLFRHPGLVPWFSIPSKIFCRFLCRYTDRKVQCDFLSKFCWLS